MILLFAKYPVAGRVKTRMIPALDPVRAARLHRRLTEAALATARGGDSPVTVCATGAPLQRFRDWLGRDVAVSRQVNGDLGRRLEHAFARALRRGAARVLAIGADVPGLTPAILLQAGRSLERADVVIGPAADGGYYLIGMRRPYPSLFRDMPWGTGDVLACTRERLRQAGLSAAMLPCLRDVDRPDDLDLVQADERLADAVADPPLLSVIIPALNEADNISVAVASVYTGREVECIVVDGGSDDDTCAQARAAGAEVLAVSGGRAAQVNAGAVHARGRRILFLHADTRLPSNFESAVHAVLDDPSVALGAFHFKTDLAGVWMRVIERGAHIRSSVFGWPYGDQGLFFERRVFEAVGRFGDLPIMEDFDLVRRMRARGRIVTHRLPAVTSGRRWRERGVGRVWVLNQIVLAGYWAGIPPARLSRLYRGSEP